MTFSLAPLEAYRDDLARANVARFGAADVMWLQAASCFWRIGQLATHDRDAALAQAALTIQVPADDPRDAAEEALDAGVHAPIVDVARHREELGAALTSAAASVRETSHDDHHGTPTAHPMHRLVGSVQTIAGDMEKAGAFRLAFSLLTAVRAALSELSPVLVGGILTQQGRIARQVGEFVDAAELYVSAERLAVRSNDSDVRVRALIGRSILSSARGNYPEARVLLRRALRAATAAGLTEHVSAAHQSLLVAALAARDLDTAFRHGWAALQHMGANPDRRAEVLGALGELSLSVGHPAAALHAYLTALELTRFSRQRLPAFGGAALAAARLHRTAVLDQLSRSALIEIAGSQHVYENAFTLLELAEAHALLGNAKHADGLRRQAVQLATTGKFFEILHRAEQLASRLSAAGATSGETDAGTGEATIAGLERVRSLPTPSSSWSPEEAGETPETTSFAPAGTALRIVRSLEALRPAVPAGVMDMREDDVC